MPFAGAPGKRRWASWVNGKLKKANRTGGITSLRLDFRVSHRLLAKLSHSPVHGQIVVNTVHQEVNSQGSRVVGEQAVDVKQEAV